MYLSVSARAWRVQNLIAATLSGRPILPGSTTELMRLSPICFNLSARSQDSKERLYRLTGLALQMIGTVAPAFGSKSDDAGIVHLHLHRAEPPGSHLLLDGNPFILCHDA